MSPLIVTDRVSTYFEVVISTAADIMLLVTSCFSLNEYIHLLSIAKTDIIVIVDGSHACPLNQVQIGADIFPLLFRSIHTNRNIPLSVLF